MNKINLDLLFAYNFKYNIHDSISKSKIYDQIKKFPKTRWVASTNKRLESIAYDIYKDTNMWLILAIYNDIVDPFVMPEKVYFIPKSDIGKILD